MTDVKMPEPQATANIGKGAYSVVGFTEAQLKQYGDDRERESLERAAKECDARQQKWEKEAAKHRPFWRVGDCERRDLERAGICKRDAAAIRALAKEIK